MQIGYSFGLIFYEFKDERKRLSCIWLVASLILLFLGLVCAIQADINKKLWTPSFVFITGGISAVSLNICLVIMDIWENDNLKKYF